MIDLKEKLLSSFIAFENQTNIDNAISNYKPPIFWKDKEIVKLHMKYWSLKSTNELIFKLNEIELIVKKQTTNSINILCDFVLSQAQINN